VLLFVKYPAKGRVKTRLAAVIGDDNALLLYRHFILDILEMLKNGGCALKICYAPPDSGGRLSSWLGKEYEYIPQRGKDLGERMKNAFIDVFSEGFSGVLLIGSDIPDLPVAVIEEAFSFRGTQAVIGPASDGGYYLIGFQRDTVLPGVFEDMPWGTEKVFEKTMELLHQHGYTVHQLPVWRDVDTIDDLKDLYRRNQGTGFAYSRTMTFLSKNKKFFVS
jgi:hypothetical protein